MSKIDDEVRLALYRFWVEHGRAPIAADLSEVLGVRPVEVEQSFRRLHDGHVIVLAPGTPYIWMANPFSAVPTPYRAELGGSTYFANCVWDAFGIVAMLGGSGLVTSHCADCGEHLPVNVFGRAIQRNDFLVHYAVPAAHWWDDIGFG